MIWWLYLLLITLFFHSRHILDSDEGVILEGAWNLLNGRKLYIDFFEFVTPGSFYIVLWLWKIFGASYWVAKFFSILIIFFSAVGIYKISNKLIISKWNNLLPFIFIFSSFSWPIINHNTFNLFFIIWAVYFFLAGLDNNSIPNFIISGLLTGISILFLQQKGIIVLLTISLLLTILLIKEKKLLWLKLNLYYSLFSLVPITLLFIKWPPKLLYENLILFPTLNYTEVNFIPLSLLSIFLFILILMIWLVKKEVSLKIWLLFLLQLSLLLSTIPRADYYHIALIIFPIYAIIPVILEKIKSGLLKKFLLALTAYSLFFVIIPSLKHILYYPPFKHILYYPPFYSAKDEELITYITNHCPGKYLHAGPFMPGLYFETKKINAMPYPFLITNHSAPSHFTLAVDNIKKNKPTCAVLNYKIVAKFNYNIRNPVDEYILQNYKQVFQQGNTIIYKLYEN